MHTFDTTSIFLGLALTVEPSSVASDLELCAELWPQSIVCERVGPASTYGGTSVLNCLVLYPAMVATVETAINCYS